MLNLTLTYPSPNVMLNKNSIGMQIFRGNHKGSSTGGPVEITRRGPKNQMEMLFLF